MPLLRLTRCILVTLAYAGTVTVQPIQAAEPPHDRPAASQSARDVALRADGTLHGEVRNSQGTTQPHVQVAVGKLDQHSVVVSTDAQGRFSIDGLSGGIYQVRTASGGAAYRVWAPHTAPPSASQGVVIIEPTTIVVGQNARNWGAIASPWVMGLIAGAAIAIPLVLDEGS